MKRILTTVAACAVIGAGAFWLLTKPAPLSSMFGIDLEQDTQAGAMVFAAAGCSSCHAAEGAKGDDRLILSGGLPFPSDFGTFYAPNISSDPQYGIGTWRFDQFARAVIKGVSPKGEHYYPAFPYTAYTRMDPQDVVNLYAYLETLPASDTPSKPHDVGFPFNIRRGLGLWKQLFTADDFVLAENQSDIVNRGRYLVEGLAHCGECHTPRNALGGLDRSAWLTGAPDPAGKGKVPAITPAALNWSEAELVEYFTSGFTPDYDSAGGKMAEIITSLAKLPKEDRAAIAAYLKALPISE